MNTSKEIIIFSASKTFTEVANNIIKSKKLDKVVDIIESTGSKIINIAKTTTNEGAKVFIARGRNTTLLRESISFPVINVQYTYEDFYNTINKSNHKFNSIALIGFDEMYETIVRFKEISGYNVQVIRPKSVDTIEKDIIKDLSPDIKVLIGGNSVKNVADKYNFEYIMPDVDLNSLNVAIDSALNILETQNEKDRYIQTILTTMNSTSEAILNFNLKGDIMFSNNIATNLFNEKKLVSLKEKIVSLIKEDGVSYDSLYDNLYNIDDKNYLVKFKPVIVHNKMQSIISIIHGANELQEEEKQLRIKLNTKGHVAKNSFTNIISNSQIMEETIYEAKKYAKSNSAVLITGETGTGKELFAQSIHNESQRANEPFVAINCAALPNSILESELFGYVKGAFTGANKEGKMGIFELAHGGTVFLDEIGEMDINIQAKILRVLQEKEISRLGDNKVVPINVRVISATNKNLIDLIREKFFREDLYYRLAVLELKIPPLNQRLDDIPYMIDHYLKENNHQVNFSSESIYYLCSQTYPGNVRQLFNTLERIIVLADKEYIKYNDFKNYLNLDEDNIYEKTSLKSLSTLHEKNEIIRNLENNYGNRKKTAEELNISLSTLWRKMKKYNIEYN